MHSYTDVIEIKRANDRNYAFVRRVIEMKQMSVNPNWPGRFFTVFKKTDKNISIINISTTTHTKGTNYSAFERFGIGLSFWPAEPLSPRAPSFRILVFFRYRRFAAVPHFVKPAARGLVLTTEYYRGLLHQDLLWKGMWLIFSIDQRLLRKLDIVKNGILRKL